MLLKFSLDVEDFQFNVNSFNSAVADFIVKLKSTTVIHCSTPHKIFLKDLKITEQSCIIYSKTNYKDFNYELARISGWAWMFFDYRHFSPYRNQRRIASAAGLSIGNTVTDGQFKEVGITYHFIGNSPLAMHGALQ